MNYVWGVLVSILPAIASIVGSFFKNQSPKLIAANPTVNVRMPDVGKQIMPGLWNLGDAFFALCTFWTLLFSEEDQKTYRARRKFDAGVNLLSGLALISFTYTFVPNQFGLSGAAGSTLFSGPAFAFAVICYLAIATREVIAAKDKTTPEGWVEQSLAELDFYGKESDKGKELTKDIWDYCRVEWESHSKTLQPMLEKYGYTDFSELAAFSQLSDEKRKPIEDHVHQLKNKAQDAYQASLINFGIRATSGVGMTLLAFDPFEPTLTGSTTPFTHLDAFTTHVGTIGLILVSFVAVANVMIALSAVFCPIKARRDRNRRRRRHAFVGASRARPCRRTAPSIVQHGRATARPYEKSQNYPIFLIIS